MNKSNLVSLILMTLSLTCLPCYAQYSGGTGTPEDPYQIATADDLLDLGGDPNNYDKNFVLTADIDLSEIPPFTQAVIAPDTEPNTASFQGTGFSGSFDGNSYVIRNLRVQGDSYLGLFGWISGRLSGAKISNLALAAVDVNGTGKYVGGLVGGNDFGSITACYSTGEVIGEDYIGGLVGFNWGSITMCYSTGEITGEKVVGGLVGNNSGLVISSYSEATAKGTQEVGGLIGWNGSSCTASYSTGSVNGETRVGGLVGLNNFGTIATCYSTGTVNEGNEGEDVGGLVGLTRDGFFSSFWDMDSSGQDSSQGGMGLKTAAMLDINTFQSAGWDLVGESSNGTHDHWEMVDGEYPTLHYNSAVSPVMPEGSGTLEEPYLIRDLRNLGTVWFKPRAHYRLETSLDLSGITWSIAVVPWFGGTFDGNGYVISNLRIQGGGYLGLFGQFEKDPIISNLGLEAVDVKGTEPNGTDATLSSY